MCTSITLTVKNRAVIHGKTNELTALYKLELFFKSREIVGTK